MRRLLTVTTLLLGCASSPRASQPPTAPDITVARGADAAAATLVHDRPPEWTTERWLNSPPLHLADLRGKVVLVRWWTADCPFCSATAPALRRFDREYAGRGLVVHRDVPP
jgi:thiol-disulfide isomerase/thioredoxin